MKETNNTYCEMEESRGSNEAKKKLVFRLFGHEVIIESLVYTGSDGTQNNLLFELDDSSSQLTYRDNSASKIFSIGKIDRILFCTAKVKKYPIILSLSHTQIIQTNCFRKNTILKFSSLYIYRALILLI